MKKIALVTLLCFAISTSVLAQTDQEILFRDIPWGTSCSDVKNQYLPISYFDIAGEAFVTCSVNEIIYGSANGINFENNDINIVSHGSGYDFTVAGYTPDEICLYYSYLVKDGKISKSEDDSALYGAEYQFKPQNTAEFTSDLTEKITSIYGEPDSKESDSPLFVHYDYKYTTWNGANNTKVVLKTIIDKSDEDSMLHMSDKVFIIYVWEGGDSLLQEANDAISNELKEIEASNYKNGNTDGL